MKKKQCKKCGVEINPKYIYCKKCMDDYKSSEQKNEVLRSLEDTVQGINRNLYALRTIQEYILDKKYKSKLEIEEETKRFKVVEDEIQ